LGDEAAVTQCVQNLLSNALKYGSVSDSVQIEIESDLDRETGKIRLNVIDHGPGVPPVDERHLFDPFHRGQMPQRTLQATVLDSILSVALWKRKREQYPTGVQRMRVLVLPSHFPRQQANPHDPPPHPAG
jgi:light-regulated signal transduction histidine kinase (bacteriophytochrome)